jgi:hypothetical protein
VLLFEVRVVGVDDGGRLGGLVPFAGRAVLGARGCADGGDDGGRGWVRWSAGCALDEGAVGAYGAECGLLGWGGWELAAGMEGLLWTLLLGWLLGLILRLLGLIWRLLAR